MTLGGPINFGRTPLTGDIDISPTSGQSIEHNPSDGSVITFPEPFYADSLIMLSMTGHTPVKSVADWGEALPEPFASPSYRYRRGDTPFEIVFEAGAAAVPINETLRWSLVSIPIAGVAHEDDFTLTVNNPVDSDVMKTVEVTLNAAYAPGSIVILSQTGGNLWSEDGVLNEALKSWVAAGPILPSGNRFDLTFFMPSVSGDTYTVDFQMNVQVLEFA